MTRNQQSLTDEDKRCIEILLAGAKISGEELAMKAIEVLYGEHGVKYAREQLDQPEM